MPKGPQEIAEQLLDRRTSRKGAKGRCQWVDLEFTEVSHAYRRSLTIRHVPTGVSASAEGFHVGRRELKDRIMPVLIRHVLRHEPPPDSEAKVTGIRGEEPDHDQESQETSEKVENPGNGAA